MSPSDRRRGAETTFRAAFARAPALVIHAPGRVNIIGEHIDYCGLEVLPFALERGVTLAAAPRSDDVVRVATTLPGLVPVSFRRGRIDAGPPGDWGNYVKAAVLAVDGDRPSAFAPTGPGERTGFDAVVAADLPIAAGLSSSSALVVACALAALSVEDPEAARAWLDVVTGQDRRLALAARVARGERFVGTAGGGMDQAVCLLGRAGHALKIAFEPLAADAIPLAPEWEWVVAHSGERAEKSGSAQATYNDRTREAAAAGRAIGDAVGRAAGWRELVGTVATGDLLEAADGLPDPLASRARHIVSEGDRVAGMVTAIGSADLPRAGRLLLESHASLREDYEVSTPRLDLLVERAVAAGAAGARLTGAGLGGSIVALCGPGRADAVSDALRGETRGSGPVFRVRPGDGARVAPART